MAIQGRFDVTGWSGNILRIEIDPVLPTFCLTESCVSFKSMIFDILGFPWDPWGPMGTPWGPMGTPWEPWEPMGTHGDPWESMGIDDWTPRPNLQAA